MASFGFSTADNSLTDLCNRAHDCARAIIKNLPRLNRKLLAKFPNIPTGGLKLRIGMSAGRAAIGVVKTDNMSNAVYFFVFPKLTVLQDVFGSIVNMAQRMEDSGRYSGLDENGVPVPFEPEDTPRVALTATPEVFEEIDKSGGLAKYGSEMEKKSVKIKGEAQARTVFVQYFHDNRT